MASRRLEDLDPRFRDIFVKWRDRCKAEGLDLLITCTLRSNAEQDELYAIGRTKPGKKVTNAQAGQSAHNYGLALDFVPLENGKPAWSDSHPAWRKAGNIATDLGLEWAGNWHGNMREFPHIQVANWKAHV